LVDFFAASGAHRELRSFPTRRSSDLGSRRRSGRRAGRNGHWRRGRRGNPGWSWSSGCRTDRKWIDLSAPSLANKAIKSGRTRQRSEEHTSELQSRENLVCRLLLEKKN